MLSHLTWAQRFMLASFVILVSGMAGIGAWVGQQIEDGVVHRTAATTALYVDSLIVSLVQELAQTDSLTTEHVRALDTLMRDIPLGQQLLTFKVWDRHGRIIYSTDPSQIGRTFPIEEELDSALHGQVSADISSLEKLENASDRERAQGKRLLEIYSPVRLGGTNQVIAAAEFYQRLDELQGEIGAAQRRSWLVVALATLAMYALLAGFMQRASNTIASQQVALSDQVAQLKSLLTQNAELHERVRRAAARTATLNERFLRRISAELHDGPAQDLGLALLKVDHLSARSEAKNNGDGHKEKLDLDSIQSSLQRALHEVRAISTGMGLPELNQVGVAETVARAVRSHERRTNSKVQVMTESLPPDAPLAVKITLYRILQEALNNASRHAEGAARRAHVWADAGHLYIQVSDQGQGFNGARETDWDKHLGLAGMRERVESLGGEFRIDSRAGQGTTVMATLPLVTLEDVREL